MRWRRLGDREQYHCDGCDTWGPAGVLQEDGRVLCRACLTRPWWAALARALVRLVK
jgi:hypothetical protein